VAQRRQGPPHDHVHERHAGGDRDLKPGASATRRFTRPGHYPYICTLHPFMQATVIVGR
jgi:plastocyanin